MKILLGTRTLVDDLHSYNLCGANWSLHCYGCGDAWGRLFLQEGLPWFTIGGECKRCPPSGGRCPGSFFSPMNWWRVGVGTSGRERKRLSPGAVDWQETLLRANPELLKHEFEVWMKYAEQLRREA